MILKNDFGLGQDHKDLSLSDPGHGQGRKPQRATKFRIKTKSTAQNPIQNQNQNQQTFDP